jgi:hypothetical protein
VLPSGTQIQVVRVASTMRASDPPSRREVPRRMRYAVACASGDSQGQRRSSVDPCVRVWPLYRETRDAARGAVLHRSDPHRRGRG